MLPDWSPFGKGKRYRKMKVILSIPGDPDGDLRLEETIVANFQEEPTFLAYSWPFPVLVLGRGQRDDLVNREALQGIGVKVVRRITGGTAIFHFNDLCVSLVLPRRHGWCKGIRPLYGHFTGSIRAALLDFGVVTAQETSSFPSIPPSPICLENRGPDGLYMDGRKVVGCAQAIRKKAVLIHGHLVLNDTLHYYELAFGVKRERLGQSIGVIPLEGVSAQEVAEAISRKVEEGL